MEKACWNCMGGQGDTEGVGCADCRYGNQPSNWRTGPNYVPGTNADRIRAMSDEELLEFLKKTVTNAYMCKLMRTEPMFLTLEWLQKKAEED